MKMCLRASVRSLQSINTFHETYVHIMPPLSYCQE